MKENSNNLNSHLLAMFRDLIKNWYWIAISLFITVGVAMVYLKFSAKKYKIASSVLLKIDETNRYGGGGSDDIVEVSSIINQKKNFQNELHTFNSTPLIREVVEEMDLRTSYFLQEDKIPRQLTFSLKEMYKASPFLVIANEDHIQPINVLFYIIIEDQDNFKIYAKNEETSIISFQNDNLIYNSIPFYLYGTYKFGQQVENEYCSFKVLLNSNYNPEMFQGKDLFFMFNDFASLTAKFRASLDVESSSLESTMVDLIFKSPNVNMGTEFLSSLINKYIEKNLDEKNFLANQTIGYIDNQLSSISDSLGITERQLQSLRSTASVMNIDEKAGNIYNQIRGLEENRRESQRQLSYLEQLDEYFLSNKDSSALLAPSSMGLNDDLLDNLIRELTTLNSEKQEIISNRQLRNPRLKTLNASIENLKNVIAENIKFSINTTRSELRELNRKITSLNAEFSRLPYTQRQLLGIERKFNLNDAVYTSLLEKRIQAQIIKSSNLPDCEVIEPPHYYAIASPKSLIVLFLAFFFGFGVPVVVILGKRLIGDRFADAKEIKTYIKIPHIGVVPHNKNPYNNVVLKYPKSAIAESFHTIRSNLIYYLFGKDNGTILVTSSSPEEGKSFSALNLATSFATTNNKTVLVEFDLRKPSKVFNEFGTRALVGISSFLINKATFDEIVIKTDIPNLDIIQAGQIPPNPVELLSSRKTRELFDELKKHYDFVIIDTPPYSLVSDSFILMKYCDIKLYVTRLGKIKKSTLISNIEDVQLKGIKDLYLLVNEDVTISNSVYSEYRHLEKNERKGIRRIFAKTT
jgi:capsular exopolysaccharide synthesis family protein